MKKTKYVGKEWTVDIKKAKKAGTCVTYPAIALQKARLIPKKVGLYFDKSGKNYIPVRLMVEKL